jgi:hypothetical protein
LIATGLALVLAVAVAGCSGTDAETEPATETAAPEQVTYAVIVEQGEIPETVLAASVGTVENAGGARLMMLSETESLYWEGSEEDIRTLTDEWRAEFAENTFYIVYSEPAVDGGTAQHIGVYSLTPTFDTVTHANAPYEEK